MRSWVALAVVLSCACAKEREAPRRASFTEVEAERGRKACASYVERVCACADGEATLAEDCELAKGRPEALDLALRAVASTQDRPDEDRWAIDDNARKIIQSCIEADLELDPQRCPRAAR